MGKEIKYGEWSGDRRTKVEKEKHVFAFLFTVDETYNIHILPVQMYFYCLLVVGGRRGHRICSSVVHLLFST